MFSEYIKKLCRRVQFNTTISNIVTELHWRLDGQPMHRNHSYLAYTSIFIQAGPVDMDAWTSQSTLLTSRHSVHNGKHDQYIFNHIYETVVFCYV